MSLAAPPFHPVARRLRQATQTRHTQVERSALMQRLLRGQLGRAAYCNWLRDLHTLYSALEDGLAAPAVQQRLAPLLDPALARSHALAQDLAQLHGPDWPTKLQPSPPALAYARHLHSLGTQPLGLAAHAYVRYLGDLAGGQVLARVVAQSLGLGDGPGLAFYDFGGPERVGALAARFRSGLDRLAHSEAEAQALEDEACAAFDRHGDWFDGRGPA